MGIRKLNMIKDNFYYCLRERLGSAQEYAAECAIRLRHLEISRKADGEFFKNNKFLFIIDEIVNLPSNIIKSYKVMRMRLYLKKCLADIKIIEQEIKKYNLVKLEKK